MHSSAQPNPANSRNSFAGKVALITGAASGIGRAMAAAFANEGASVVVADVAADEGQSTAKALRESGGQAAFVKADVTQADQVEAMVEATIQHFGGLDFAMNNAGVDGARAVTASYPQDVWTRVIDINLTGVFLCMKYELPVMLHRQGGVIVNVSSVAGVTGFPSHAAYAASKHGVIGLTRTAALEYAKTGIRVNALCPAYTFTPMLERGLGASPDLVAKLTARVPARRLGTPEGIAAAAVYLCSDAASFITGHSLVLDGGITAG